MKYKKRHEWFLHHEQTLASVVQRIAAMVIDIVLIILLFFLIAKIFEWLGFEINHIGWTNFSHVEIKAANMSEKAVQHLKIFLAFVPTLYFALTMYVTNGQTIGKKIVGIRVISIYHRRIGLWHCIERSLGYVASTLELGLGFLQIFWNPNRMTLHDRIAETLVIKTRITKKK